MTDPNADLPVTLLAFSDETSFLEVMVLLPPRERARFPEYESYGAFLTNMAAREKYFKDGGYITARAVVSAKDFKAWCAQQNQPTCNGMLTVFASLKLAAARIS